MDKVASLSHTLKLLNHTSARVQDILFIPHYKSHKQQRNSHLTKELGFQTHFKHSQRTQAHQVYN